VRAAVWALVLAALAPAALLGASAYEAAQLEARGVVVEVVADAAAYLAVAANGDHAYDCLVAEQDGRLVITIGALTGCADPGAGTGINAGDGSDAAKWSRYAFHDLLVATNKGTTTALLWVNATTDANAAGALLDTAKEASAGTMTDADYAATSATPLTLAVGESAFVGLRAISGTLTAGNFVEGTLTIVSRAG